MNRFISAIMIASAIFFSGCQYVNPIGPLADIGVYWYEGEAHKYYACDKEVIHNAVKSVMKEFKYPILSEEVKGRTTTIKAGDDNKFKIKIVAVRDNITTLSIRVDTFGDKPFTEMIYRHIDMQAGVKQFATVKALNAAYEKQRR